MSRVARIGVLGCANIAERFVLPAIKESDLFELVGVASRSKDKADSFSNTFNTKAYYSYDSLLQSNLDAIYIPLPNGMHYEWIKKALNKKLHVLVEKSLACDLDQVKELNQLARDNELALVENFQFRFHNQIKFIQKKLDDGHLGEIKLLRSSFGFPPFEDKDNIRYQKTLGGGALLDAGAYTIKVSQIFLGDEIYVDSASLTRPHDQEVDIWGSASIKQENGHLTAQIAFGFDNFYQNTLEIWGSKGKLTASRIFTAGPGVQAKVTIENRDGIDAINLPEDNHFLNMLDHFSELINTGNGIDNEYSQNINQARLIRELSDKSRMT
jgi:dTDP-3,4-didehydro-2,6-dideoxy-alpha-D-glucose 3-reductase